MEIEAYLKEYPRAAVALSGGVDSSYLLWVAARCCAQVKAYCVRSEFQPRFEIEDARRIAAIAHAELEILDVSVLSAPEVTCNAADRCYRCKKLIFGAIRAAAARDGFPCLLDGTNASDDAGSRPGMRALEELAVLSPLRACGLTKDAVRARARAAGLFTWDKPAYACLATRIPTGEEITAEKLARTERAETFLAALGFTNFRVRTASGAARVQLPASQLAEALRLREEIVCELKRYYSAVTLDLEVRDES